MKKITLVTGASAGIGWDIAEYLNRKGFSVVAAARRLEKMHPLKEQGVYTIVMDVGDAGSVDAALERIGRDVGAIDILINNAATKVMGPAALIPMADVRHLFDVNFFGLVDLTQKCLPHMQAQAWGRVINLSSMGGLFCTPFNSAYSSAKFALESWSRTLKQEVKKFGVEVSLIRPGAVKSEIFDNVVNKTEQELAWAGEWQAVFSSFLNEMAKTQAEGADPVCVSEIVHKIITSESPRVGYIAPADKEEWVVQYIRETAEDERDSHGAAMYGL